MKSLILTSAILLSAEAMPAQAAQILLSGNAVIGDTGSYGDRPATNIFDQQTGAVSDLGPNGENQYWINAENGAANAFITVDLGASYTLGSFSLFNTHNGNYGDRGTGQFEILAANSVTLDGGNGYTLSGPTTLLASGTLAATAGDPITGQSFAALSNASFRYIQFVPLSESSVNPPCCSAAPIEYGLSELRVYGTQGGATGAVPEPASWALMLGGFGAIGTAMRGRRKAAVSFG